MDSKRFLVATIVGFITLFLMGAVLFGLIFMDFMVANRGTAVGAMKEMPLFLWLGLGELLLAALITMFLDLKGVSGAAEGFKAALVFGLLYTCAIAFTMYGVSNLSNLTATIAEALIGTLRIAITGAVIAMVLSRGGGEAAA